MKSVTSKIRGIFGYTDEYYQKKATEEAEEKAKLEEERKETERWLKKMQKKAAHDEEENVKKERKKKKSKLQQRLNEIRVEAQEMEREHKENVRILKATIDAYTHIPEIGKVIKNIPAHHTPNTEDVLHNNHKDEELNKQRAEYSNDNLPNPWWKVPGVKQAKFDKEYTWDEVKKLYNYDFVPGHYHDYRGVDRIFGFPPTSEKDKKKRKNERKDQITRENSRYQWDDKEQAYARSGFKENADKPLGLSFADNNRTDEAYEAPSLDGVADAIYKWRTEKPSYPETKLLPTAEQLKAAAAQSSRAKARIDYPDFKFRRDKLDMSRLRVRRYLINDSGDGSVSIDEDGSSIIGDAVIGLDGGSVAASVVDVKLPRYSTGKSQANGSLAGDGTILSGGTPNPNPNLDDDDSAIATSLPKVHWNGKPVITHDMSKPMLSMQELTTMGLGGKAGPYHPPADAKPTDGSATKINNEMTSGIDIAFNTDRARLIAEANKADVALDGIEVYHRVGDHYVLENKSAMSRRSDFEEDSLSLSRQKVRVKLRRHRGALGLDRFHLSRKNKCSLESKATKRERRIERAGKKALKESLAQVQTLVNKIKEEEDAKAEAKRREMHRQGAL